MRDKIYTRLNDDEKRILDYIKAQTGIQSDSEALRFCVNFMGLFFRGALVKLMPNPEIIKSIAEGLERGK